MMEAKHLDDPTKWEVHILGQEYCTNMADAQWCLEEIVGIPANHARILIRRAKAQGPTLVTDGVLLIPPME